MFIGILLSKGQIESVKAVLQICNCHNTCHKLLLEFCHSYRLVTGLLAFLYASIKILKWAISGSHSRVRIDGYE
jgi:hypothetical protein